MLVAKIAVSRAVFAIDKPYSYRLPLYGPVPEPGQRVTIPFGVHNHRAEGIVLSVEEEEDTDKLKTVEAWMDDGPILTPEQLRLAAFIRERYFCTFYEAARAMLPAGLWFSTNRIFYLTEDLGWKEKPPKKAGIHPALQLMEEMGGRCEEKQLRPLFSAEEELDQAISYLLRKKWIRCDVDYKRRTSDKTERIAVLAYSGEEIMEFAAKLPRSAYMQRRVLEQLSGLGSASVKELAYYTGAGSGVFRSLEQKGYILLQERPVFRCRDILPARLDGPLVLNEEQQRCYDGLAEQMDQEKPGVALLHGVTGSGKTSVYIRLIRTCLDRGRAAVLMVPEIALTPQLMGIMAAHFGQKVAVLHSNLGSAERVDQWKRIRTGEATVVVGTRSAVFAPCNCGLIILDEEQESSYRSENNPRYCAREIAMWRGVKEQALVLLGSATPSVESMYRAKQGDYRLYTLKERYGGRPLPQVQIVDMRRELQLGNDTSLSIPLREAMTEARQGGKQTVLLLNRRGASRALLCVDCGEAPECPRCRQWLTFHSANRRLMCHHCGHSQRVPDRCPVCGGHLKTVGTGTQKIRQELMDLYPDMPVERMDADTVNAVNTHEKILDRFQKEQIPVLLGTQMVAKGLNFPEVTLVGVLDADLSLYTGGYRAAETTFNLLTQVVGRAGRGDTPGQALIQTLVPDNQIIRLAARQDYEAFYQLELPLRRVQNAPPFADQVSVIFLSPYENILLQGACKFRDSLVRCLEQPQYKNEFCQCLGPAPCAVPQINYNLRYRLTLKCLLTRNLRQLLAQLLRQFSQDGLNRKTTAYIDVNGFE